MTRCPEFYAKWEREPNWCNKCQSAVSQIDNYLGLVGELEKEGVDRNITFAILPETIARGILTVKDRNKERTTKNLAAYLKSPNCTKIRVSQIHGFVQRREPQPYTPPSYEAKIRQNEKKIEQYQINIRILEQENERLRGCILRDSPQEMIPVADSSNAAALADKFIGGIDRMLLLINPLPDSFITREEPGTVKVIGHDAARKKLLQEPQVPGLVV